MAWSFKREILGTLISMKNGRVMIPARKTVIKSPKAQQFETDLLKQIGANRIPFEGQVGMRVTVWFSNPRSDLDVELLKDILQAPKPPRRAGANVIKDDNQIIEVHAYKRVDKKRPRLVFELYEITA